MGAAIKWQLRPHRLQKEFVSEMSCFQEQKQHRDASMADNHHFLVKGRNHQRPRDTMLSRYVNRETILLRCPKMYVEAEKANCFIILVGYNINNLLKKTKKKNNTCHPCIDTVLPPKVCSTMLYWFLTPTLFFGAKLQNNLMIPGSEIWESVAFHCL